MQPFVQISMCSFHKPLYKHVGTSLEGFVLFLSLLLLMFIAYVIINKVYSNVFDNLHLRIQLWIEFYVIHYQHPKALRALAVQLRI